MPLASNASTKSSKPDSPEMPSVVATSSPTELKESSSVPGTNSTSTASSKFAVELNSITEAKLKRAERFGIPPGESEKAALRAARFGILTKATDSTNKNVLKGNGKLAKPCFVFQATQSCDRGDLCKFFHPEVVTDEEKAAAVAKVAEVYLKKSHRHMLYV